MVVVLHNPVTPSLTLKHNTMPKKSTLRRKLSPFLFSLLFTSSAFAQLPVSTSPQNKKVIMEEFTGIYCYYCPDGHRVGDSLLNVYPNDIIPVAIQCNYFGIPKVPGDVDMRTVDGNLIETTVNYNGFGWAYPSVAFNRTILSQTTMPNPYRAQWAGDVITIKNQPAYLNVALQGSVNVNTRMLTVDAQVYYTGSSPTATNYLTIMLIEKNITGLQENDIGFWPANINPDSTYNHHHVLRDVLTPTWGTPIVNTTAGSSYSTSLSYSIPLKYGTAPYDNTCYLGNIELVAFVTQGTQTLTINGARGPIALTGITNSLDIAPINIVTDKNVCQAKMNSNFKFENKGSSTVTNAVFTYSVNGLAMPNYTYNGNVGPMNISPVIMLPVSSFSAQTNNTLNIQVGSVNASSDQNAANDINSATVPLTSLVATNKNILVTFMQDQYGNECKWRVFDESNNALVSSDGPWTNLGSNGTQLHQTTFTVNPNSCYRMEVFDGVNNGINTSYGSGYYSVSAGSTVMYTSNGKYGRGEKIWFKTNITTDVSKALITVSDMRLYPNPSIDETTLNIEMFQDEKMNMHVVNELGQLIYSDVLDLNSGENNVKLNTSKWNAGVYIVKLNSNNGSVSKKLTVVK